VTDIPVKQEFVGLCVALEAINGMANHTMLQILGLDDSPHSVEVRFQTRAHQALFLARLLDFAKEPTKDSLTGVDGSCIEVLRTVCEARRVNPVSDARLLCKATAEFRDWLNSETRVALRLPTVDVEVVLNVPRIDFLFIAGNYAKHNLSRLTGVARSVVSVLKQHGHAVTHDQAILALHDIGDTLQEDYFSYYATWLAELLNNLRWGIQVYLQPIFDASFKIGTREFEYSYSYPPGVDDEISRAWFWRLMNHVRAGPSLAPFSGAEYMKRAVLRGDTEGQPG